MDIEYLNSYLFWDFHIAGYQMTYWECKPALGFRFVSTNLQKQYIDRYIAYVGQYLQQWWLDDNEDVIQVVLSPSNHGYHCFSLYASELDSYRLEIKKSPKKNLTIFMIGCQHSTNRCQILANVDLCLITADFSDNSV